MLLEDPNKCCICDRDVRRIVGGFLPTYYCATCFEEHKADILARAPWVHWLMNGERQRRKRRNRLLESGYTLAPSYSAGRT